MKIKKIRVSIIIKTLNEEDDIRRAIKSALKSLKGIKGEVILSDSLSTDKTIEIAKKYSIKIIQLSNPKDRCCGVGAQLGYMHSKGDYIYILDGDMELDENFLPKAILELDSEKRLAGVGGRVTEMTDSNIVFRRRKKGNRTAGTKSKYVDNLMMGGLYKKKAIKKVSYFSNPYLHAYEESDLGHRLTTAGYKLKSIPIDMIKHHGDETSSIKIFRDRWKSRYLWGCGEFLRYNFGKPTFLKVVTELKLYLFVLLWWFTLAISLFLYKFFPEILALQLLLTTIFLLLFLIKKRSITEFVFSIFSWNITALGLIFGFLRKPKNINRKIPMRKIK